MKRRGSMLIEVVAALAIFALVGLLVLTSVRDGLAGLERSYELQRAVDLARSCMARIESGISTAEELDGPALPWDGDPAAIDGRDPLNDDPDGLVVEIDLEQSEFASLWRVTVRIFAPDAAGMAPPMQVHGPIYELTQLVRLDEASAADTLPEDALMEEIRRAAERGGA